MKSSNLRALIVVGLIGLIAFYTWLQVDAEVLVAILAMIAGYYFKEAKP